MQKDLLDVEQRVRRYWYIDGIGELMGGGMCLLLGLYFSAQQYIGVQSLLGGILQSGFAVILIGGVTIAQRLVHRLKTRLTYPRTGYVEYETSSNKIMPRRLFAAGIAMMVAMFLVVIMRRIDAIDSMVAVTGVLFAAILLVKQGWSSGMPRFYFLSVLALVLGIILSISGFARGYNLGVFYGLMRVAFAISGGLTLRRYLQQNPLPVEEPNG